MIVKEESLHEKSNVISENNLRTSLEKDNTDDTNFKDKAYVGIPSQSNNENKD